MVQLVNTRHKEISSNLQENSHRKTSLIWINIKGRKCRIGAAISILICLARKITGENVLPPVCTSNGMLASKSRRVLARLSLGLVRYCSPDVSPGLCLLHEYLSGINLQIGAVGLGSP